MASKPAARSITKLLRRATPTCDCATTNFSRSSPIRQLSTSAVRKDQEYETEKEQRPRWSYTPEKMKAPYPWRIKNTERVWVVNDDPVKLDRFYNNFLGQGGDQMLSEEVKWLAITHKSFDQGRRGFNDRLAFMGRRILTLQTNLALLNSSYATSTQSAPETEDREPFKHPALKGLQNLVDVPVPEILTKRRIGGLATQLGMPGILRWTPKNLRKMEESGIDTVLTTSVFAIIGAIALQRGGDVAAEVAREKVLKPLGIS